MKKSVILVCCLCVFSWATLRAAPPDFAVHTIEKDSPLVNDAVMSVTLSDLDGDGDLDWTVGTVWPKGPHKKSAQNLDFRTLYWYEYQAPHKWTKHVIGRDRDAYGAACTLDANGDGRRDFVAGKLWTNLGDGKWKSSETGIGDGGHDMQAVDINGDKRLDVLAFTQRGGLNWFEIPDNPHTAWKKHRIAPPDYAGGRVHACGSPRAAGDLDGDGDVDIAAVHGWFENEDRKGAAWKYHRQPLFPSTKARNFPWGFAVKTYVCDLDGDGDNDIVQTENDTPVEAGIVWLENTSGKGDFRRHWILQRTPSDYHTLQLFDYDLDGDLDILTGTGPLATNPNKAAILLENLGAGKQQGEENATLQWKRHEIHRGMPIHEARAGDVDGDGDADIILKPWNQKDHPKHFLYLENLLKKDGSNSP